MNRIRLLSEQVANQIAAGEVIERPASVVKELVENALDAEAQRITIEIQAGGRSLIRVTDDGVGMSRDDALLSLERHATSKIQHAEDLEAITTMGFRGEAMPTIASVSRMTITTRERDSSSPAGTAVVIHGGKIIEVKEAGCAPGTAIEVRQLFFNLPARRKFLKTDETEKAHIQHYVTLAALAFPGVGFTFISDARVLWQLPPAKTDAAGRLESVRERLRALYGAGTRLLPVDFAVSIESERVAEDAVDETRPGAAVSSLRVSGFVGVPGVSRASRDEQHLFVNRRPVENRALNFALIEGYHTALMKGRYPVCCLFLEIDPAEVDVNIHPAKREVKFRHEPAVRRIVAEAVRRALLDFHSAGAPQHQQVETPPPEPVPPRDPSTQQPAENESISRPRPAEPQPRYEQSTLRSFNNQDVRPEAPPQPAPASSGPAKVEAAPAPVAQASQAQNTVPVGDEAVPLLHVPLRIVGVIGRLYVVLESDRGMVLLDQHAAHERILYEQMLRRLEREGHAPSQRLLLPETIELSARDVDFLRQQLATLGRLGVGLSEFGERTFLLDALPPFVRVADARQYVLELVDELKKAGDSVNSWRLGEHTIAKTVCRHAVKANDPLAGPELQSLVDDLRHCHMPYTCPHGRPTLIEMNFRELERKFGRIQ